MSVRLIVRGLPLEDTESLIGFLLRLAGSNGLVGISGISAYACVPRSAGTRPFDLRPLVHALGATVDKLRSVACWPDPGTPGVISFGPHQTVLAGDRRAELAPFCPDCLLERAVFRRTWELRAGAACRRHGTLLVARCNRCNALIRWSRKYLLGCDCGFDLRESGRVRAGTGVLDVASELEAMQGRHGGAGTISLATSARLVWFCGTWNPVDTRTRRSMFLARPEPSAALPIIERGACAIRAFPAGFHKWLSSIVSLSVAPLRAAFGGNLTIFRTAFPHGTGHEVIAAMRTWFRDNWTGSTPKWNTIFTEIQPTRGMLDVAGAAREAEMSVNAVRRMVATNAVPSRSFPHGTRTTVLVDVALVRLAVGANKQTTLAEAVSMLGITRAAWKRMRAAGLLPARDGAAVPAISADPVSDAGRLKNRIEAACSKDIMPTGCISLHDLSARRQVAMAEVFTRILSSDLPAWHRSGADAWLATIYVVAGRTLDRAGGPATVSVREAALSLGVATRMVPVMVAAGCLDAARPQDRTGGLGHRSVSAPSVRRFSQDFVLTKDVAAVLKTSTRVTIIRLCAAGCLPVIRNDSARGISAVWSVAEVRQNLGVGEGAWNRKKG